MTLSTRKYRPHLFLLAIVAAAACSDRTSPTQPPHLSPQPPGKDISDGAHVASDGKLGNSDVFFLPPMVSNPVKATGYGDPFQAGLPVAFRITDQNTNTVIKNFVASVDLTNQFYSANWDTKASPIDLTHTYRINALIGSKIVAYADVLFGATGASLKNIDTDDFVGLVDGRTLPMKVRIEKGWDCLDKTSCVTQAVPNKIPSGQTVIVSTGGTLPNSAEFSPSGDGTWATNVDGSPITGPIVVTIQDVTSNFPESKGGCGNGLTLQLTQNHCVRITTDPAVRLTSRVRVGTCLANPGDDRQLLVKYDTDPNHQEAPRFLQDAPPPAACPVQIGSATIHSSNPLVRLAARVTDGVGRGLNWVLGVKPAYAFDTGVGGFVGIGDGFSLFAPAFPRRMLAGSGDGQQAAVGTQVANDLVVHFTFVHDVGEDPARADINGASLTCLALTKGSRFATVGTADGPTSSIPATSLGNGLYSCGRPFLSQDAGANQFKVTATGVPDAVLFDVGNDAIQLPGSVTFTATGTDQSQGGDDIVVINDINPFMESMTSANNQRLVRNLVSFTNDKPRSAGTKVWFDQAVDGLCNTRNDAGAPTFTCGQPGAFASFRQALIAGTIQSVVDVSSSDEASPLSNIPSDVKVIVLLAPQTNYTPNEINSLRRFGLDGGRIVLIGDNTVTVYANGLAAENDLLSQFNGYVQGLANSALLSGNNSPVGPAAIQASPITAGLTGLLFGGAGALQAVTDSYATPLIVLDGNVLMAVMPIFDT
jgi:hypothetical protein